MSKGNDNSGNRYHLDFWQLRKVVDWLEEEWNNRVVGEGWSILGAGKIATKELGFLVNGSAIRRARGELQKRQSACSGPDKDKYDFWPNPRGGPTHNKAVSKEIERLTTELVVLRRGFAVLVEVLPEKLGRDLWDGLSEVEQLHLNRASQPVYKD